MTKLLVLLLVFCIQAQKTTTVVKEYTPRELEVTPWPDTTTTMATTSMTNVDLFQEREIEHDQETDYMENYESTSNEFIQTGLSASDLEKLKDIQIRIASSDSNKPELNVTDYDYFNEIEFSECRNFTSGDDNVSHFPHRTEIGLQFALNMMTLASWLIVIIVYARQGERHEPRQKLITGIILAASSFYLIASLFAVTSAQIGLFSSSHRYTEYDESCLAYLFGSGFSTMKNVCGWMKIIAFYACQWSQCLLFCLIVKEKTWKKETEDLCRELSPTLANAALAPAKRRFLILGGAVTSVAITISIVLNVKTDWFYTDNGDMFTITKDLGLFRSFRLPESTGHLPFIMLTLPIPILALVLFIVMMINVLKTRQMRLRSLNRDGSDRSDKSAGVREAERQKVVRNRVHLLQMNLLFLSNIAYFIATTYKYVYRESPHAWVANFVLFYFTAVPFGHILPSAPMATAKQHKQSVQSNL